MCLLQLSLVIVYVTLFTVPVSLDECTLCCLPAGSLLFLQNVQIEGPLLPFLASVTEVSSVTLQKDVSLVSPKLTGL